VTNTRLPPLGSDRAAFIALLIVGMTIRAVRGIGRAQSTLGWTDPVTLVGIVLGSAAVLLAAAVSVEGQRSSRLLPPWLVAQRR
jgi:hypothetical protein